MERNSVRTLLGILVAALVLVAQAGVVRAEAPGPVLPDMMDAETVKAHRQGAELPRQDPARRRELAQQRRLRQLPVGHDRPGGPGADGGRLDARVRALQPKRHARHELPHSRRQEPQGRAHRRARQRGPEHVRPWVLDAVSGPVLRHGTGPRDGQGPARGAGRGRQGDGEFAVGPRQAERQRGRVDLHADEQGRRGLGDGHAAPGACGRAATPASRCPRARSTGRSRTSNIARCPTAGSATRPGAGAHRGRRFPRRPSRAFTRPGCTTARPAGRASRRRWSTSW